MRESKVSRPHGKVLRSVHEDRPKQLYNVRLLYSTVPRRSNYVRCMQSLQREVFPTEED